ncbi:transmembrane 115-like [Paramuricea clavata]|uniref:Transmembrane 115-like n=1 Tax=Paramuricea clavata TaxID=317549 RepID=A0A7D9HVV5_PARCT|nr:transmembrane 115-like [Paramuricea clavata]
MASSMNDFNHLKNQINKALGDASIVVKISCGLVSLFYVLGYIPHVYDVLAVTPGSLIPPHFKIWTLITGGFIEYRVWNVVADIIVLVLCGRILEPLWGALEFLKYITILNVGTSLIASGLCLLYYLVTDNIYVWFLTFSGMNGILAGVTVALKQSVPETELKLLMLSIKVKYLPSLMVLCSVPLWLVQLLPLINVILTISGVILGWIYLRFYQQKGKGAKGDLRDGFAFSTFFPEPLQAPVSTVSNLVFNWLIKFNICSKPIRTYDVGAPSAITISLPGMDPADAERRRQKALKALDERMSKLEQPASWPSLDDPAEDKTLKDIEVIEEPDVVIVEHKDPKVDSTDTTTVEIT